MNFPFRIREFHVHHAPTSLTLIALAAALFCSGCAPKEKPKPAPRVARVVVEPAATENLVEYDEYTGRLAARETVEIRPRVSGYIDKISFQAGKPVRKGDPLFTIDPRPFANEVAQLKAQVDSAQASLKLAEIEFQRIDQLRKTGAVSQEDFDRRLTQRLNAQSSLAAAQASLATAQLNLSFTDIRAPIDGIVSREQVTTGNLVQGGAGGATLLTTIVSISPVYAYVDVDENAMLKYQTLARKGERATARETTVPMEMALQNETGYPHQGYIDFVDTRVNPKTGTINARGVFDNSILLFTPGQFVRLRVTGSGRYDAVLVSDRAIASDQSLKYVYVIGDDNKAQYRSVELGPLTPDGRRIIRKGVKPNEKVVVSGIQQVQDGTTVEIVTPSSAPNDTATTTTKK